MNFEELKIPLLMRISHEMNGGRGMRRWFAPLADGVLRVMFGREPYGKDGERFGHFSISVGKSAEADTPPSRRPTDSECQAGLALLDAQGWGEYGSTVVRHFWEK